MRNVILYSVITLLVACNHGIWITQSAYRPKHAKFKISKETFVGDPLIDSTHIYFSTKRLLNADGRILSTYMGFYNDGRMIFDNTWENEMSITLQERNSFNTATTIGYYTTHDKNLEMEFFVPGDGGHYETRKGVIKKDTIILIESHNSIFWKGMQKDTLVKSSFFLK